MKIAALFPGQGSQYPGMARDLTEQFPWTKQIYEEASDAIKEDCLKLCLEGPDSTLQLTFNAQPCILTTSFAWFQVLRRALDLPVMAGGGHSLGEYSALLSSGAIGLSDAVRTVRKRGELMQSQVKPGEGKMAALLGLADDKVEELCKLATQGNSIVSPANYNAPSQVVVAGHAAAVDRLQILATDGARPDLQARKVVPLNVSAPFHCSLMKPVADSFVSVLQGLKWNKMAFPVASNLNGQLRADGDLIPSLRDQIDHPVRWTACVQNLEKAGAEVFVEMGPGKVLVGLAKRIAEKAKLFSMDSFADLQKFEKAYRGNFA